MKKILAVAVAVAALSCVGFAAEAGTKSVGVNAGYAIPVSGDWGDYLDASFFGGVYGEYNHNEQVAFGLEFGYNFKHPWTDATDYGVKFFNISPYVKYMMDQNTAHLFAVAGVGYYAISGDDVESEGKMGMHIGIGSMFDVGTDMQLGGEIRWQHVFNDEVAVNNIVPMFKFAYLFK